MDNTKDEYLLEIVDDLFPKIGLIENMSTAEISEKIDSFDIQQRVQFVAMCLGLPTRINISIITNNGINNNIGARVFIPENMPMYGSKELAGFPVNMEIKGNITYNKITFVAVVAHELAHILLASIKSDKKTDELYTDISSMMLGFIDVIDAGRKVVNYTTYEGNTKTDHTTTYGYLNDHQFYIVKKRINKGILNCKKYKQTTEKRLTVLKHRIKTLNKDLKFLNRIFNYLSKNITRIKIVGEDSNKMQYFYNNNYFDDFKKTLSTVEYDTYQVDIDLFNLNHYFKDSFDVFYNKIDLLENSVNSSYNDLSKNILLFKKYTPFYIYYFIFILNKLFH